MQANRPRTIRYRSAQSARRPLARLVPAVVCALGIFTASAGTAAGGTIFITDYSVGTVDSITQPGGVSTFATGLTLPQAIVAGRDGNLYVACQASSGPATVCKVTPAGVVSTIATGFTDPTAIAQNASGNLFVSFEADDIIGEVQSNGTISTFATLPGEPEGLVFNGSGDLFAATLEDDIYEISPSGQVSLFAADVLRNAYAAGLAMDSQGNLYMSNDLGTIDKIAPSGSASVYAINVGQALNLAFDNEGDLWAASVGEVVSISPSLSITKYTSGIHVASGVTFAVPEPNGVVLFSIGAAVLCSAVRIRRASKAATSRSMNR